MGVRRRFPSRRSQPQVIVAGRKSAPRELGLHLAVAEMSKGEKVGGLESVAGRGRVVTYLDMDLRQARVCCTPEYGFGDKGSFSFPSVPPNSDLIYEVELVGFDEVDEASRGDLQIGRDLGGPGLRNRPRCCKVQERSVANMTFEERLDYAERRKVEGNDLFKGQKWWVTRSPTWTPSVAASHPELSHSPCFATGRTPRASTLSR